MATNLPKGPGRIGAVKQRSQTFNPVTQQLDQTGHEDRAIHGRETGWATVQGRSKRK
jgi:hypothetical protein